MPTFVTPPGYSGTAELTASNGLEILDQGLWTFSRYSYADGASFGLSLTSPQPTSGGELHLRAVDWTISGIGNDLTSWTDPDTAITYPASRCRITVTGYWQVPRQQNSDSFNSVGVLYAAVTETDQGTRIMDPWLLSYNTTESTYVIQGSDVDGGALDTFSDHVFECRLTESTRTHNSNGLYQSNSVTRPVWAYSYAKSWQID